MYTEYMYKDSLAHHGIKGQRWGVRRYQNPDGTLTPEGRARYGAKDWDVPREKKKKTDLASMSDKDFKKKYGHSKAKYMKDLDRQDTQWNKRKKTVKDYTARYHGHSLLEEDYKKGQVSDKDYRKAKEILDARDNRRLELNKLVNENERSNGIKRKRPLPETMEEVKSQNSKDYSLSKNPDANKRMQEDFNNIIEARLKTQRLYESGKKDEAKSHNQKISEYLNQIDDKYNVNMIDDGKSDKNGRYVEFYMSSYNNPDKYLYSGKKYLR